jgi:cell division protein FtsW (lipid II flippase)
MARATTLGVVVAAVTAFVLVRVGAPWHWAVLIALPVGALALFVARLPRATDVVWTPLPATISTATFVQASTLASRLAEAAVDQDRFVTRVQPRLRRLAEARLRQQHGVHSLQDPRARDLLGADLHRLLTDPTAPLPEPSKLADLLENL